MGDIYQAMRCDECGASPFQACKHGPSASGRIPARPRNQTSSMEAVPVAARSVGLVLEDLANARAAYYETERVLNEELHQRAARVLGQLGRLEDRYRGYRPESIVSVSRRNDTEVTIAYGPEPKYKRLPLDLFDRLSQET